MLHIVLLGAMGSGKSTVGAVLAESLGVLFVDSDDQIQQRMGATGAEIAATNGVESLHRIEWQVLLDALTAATASVIAAAASVVDNPDVRRELRRHRCIWLDADPLVLAERRERKAHRRPLPRDDADTLNLRREALVGEVTIGRVDTGKMSVEQSLSAIRSLLD